MLDEPPKPELVEIDVAVRYHDIGLPYRIHPQSGAAICTHIRQAMAATNKFQPAIFSPNINIQCFPTNALAGQPDGADNSIKKNGGPE
jgi:hypothetical protein